MSSFNRHRVHHSINSHTRKYFLLLKRNSEFIERIKQFRVNFIKTLWTVLLFRSRVITYCLEIYLRNIEMRPSRNFKSEPMTECFQTKFKQPFGFTFLLRNQSHHIFVKALWNDFGVNICYKSIFILTRCNVVDNVITCFNTSGICFFIHILIFVDFFHYLDKIILLQSISILPSF